MMHADDLQNQLGNNSGRAANEEQKANGSKNVYERNEGN